MTTIQKKIQNGRILISNGAWGTFLQDKGLGPGECSELWNIEHPEEVFEIAKSYIDAGANIIGGCCGTTPEHIRRIVNIFQKNSNSQFDLKKKHLYLKLNMINDLMILCSYCISNFTNTICLIKVIYHG